MPQFLYGHAEWVETKDLTLGNFEKKNSKELIFTKN